MEYFVWATVEKDTICSDCNPKVELVPKTKEVFKGFISCHKEKHRFQASGTS
uniref:Uncharacterized protein n=1 Tax=Octopus bimaculoides TaxID=37653 RepID=A0A0L8G054_OCTBM